MKPNEEYRELLKHCVFVRPFGWVEKTMYAYVELIKMKAAAPASVRLFIDAAEQYIAEEIDSGSPEWGDRHRAMLDDIRPLVTPQ